MRRCSAASERCAQNAAPDAGGTRASSVGGGRQQRASGRGLRARGRVTLRRPKIAWRENAARRRRRFAGVEVRGARARPVWAAGAREGGGCGAKQRLARAEVRGEGQQQQRARRRRRRRRRPSSRKWLSPAFTPVIMNCRPKSRPSSAFCTRRGRRHYCMYNCKYSRRRCARRLSPEGANPSKSRRGRRKWLSPASVVCVCVREFSKSRSSALCVCVCVCVVCKSGVVCIQTQKDPPGG